MVRNFTKGLKTKTYEKDKEFRYGLMDRNTKDGGNKIKRAEKEDLFTQMVMCM